MRSRLFAPLTDRILLTLGLILGAVGLVLSALDYKDSLILAVIGFSLSMFSYFGMRLADLGRQVEASTNVTVILDEEDNFERSKNLVSRVPPGGRILATSTFLGGDADGTTQYRDLVNQAIARRVFYQKIICFEDEPESSRLAAWQREVDERNSFLQKENLPASSTELLHYPGLIHLDVLISQSRTNEALEMVAGFTGRNRRGGFVTQDRQMVSDWLQYYLEEIAALARKHTEAVLNGSEQCACSELLRRGAESGSAPNNEADLK